MIRLNKNGDVHEWKTESDGVYNDEIVAALASAAWENGPGEGRLGDQAYRAEARKYGTLIVAMAITPEIAYTKTLLRITLLAGAAACALLSLLAALTDSPHAAPRPRGHGEAAPVCVGRQP